MVAQLRRDDTGELGAARSCRPVLRALGGNVQLQDCDVAPFDPMNKIIALSSGVLTRDGFLVVGSSMEDTSRVLGDAPTAERADKGNK